MKKSNNGIDYTAILNSIEKYSPLAARTVLLKALNLYIPFNAHLKSSLKLWTNKKTVVKLGLHRGVKNHLGGVHAGALFTLSESAAGILLIRNFNPTQYRLIMQTATIEYFKQARGPCEAICEISTEKVSKVKAGVKTGKPFSVMMLTKVQNPAGEILCTLKTKWQIKPWDQVKTK